MIIFFVSVTKQQINDFENGVIDGEEITKIFVKSDQIRLQEIDRVMNVLAEDDEFSKYWDIFNSGEILAGGDGEAFLVEHIDVEFDDGDGFSICEPAVYVLNEEVKETAAFLSEIDEKQFKESFETKIKKLTKWSFLNKNKKALKETAPEIYEIFWNELETLRNFYQKVSETDNFIVIFPMYEEEDFEEK